MRYSDSITPRQAADNPGVLDDVAAHLDLLVVPGAILGLSYPGADPLHHVRVGMHEHRQTDEFHEVYRWPKLLDAIEPQVVEPLVNFALSAKIAVNNAQEGERFLKLPFKIPESLIHIARVADLDGPGGWELGKVDQDFPPFGMCLARYSCTIRLVNTAMLVPASAARRRSFR